MKPRIFIGSSVENLDVAYAAQESLEHTCEATVWDQGIFTLSRSSMASLIDAVDEADFGLFIFAPDDVTNLRNKDLNTVRDNVVFELGLFIGRLGQERNFIIMPRGVSDFHLPTDLLGITPGEYEPERQDGNLVAALGPAMNRVRKAILKHGKFVEEAVATEMAAAAAVTDNLISDGNDCVSLIQSWLGSRSAAANMSAIKLSDVDRELGLEPGSTRTHIRAAAAKYNYSVAREGAEIVMLEYHAPRTRGPSYF